MLRRTIILGVLLLTTSNAGAQSATDPADAEFRQGNSLYKEQRWAEARDAYDRAWQLKKTHDIAANLAYAEMKLGRFRDAAEHLAFAVRTWPPTGKSDKREYATERLQLAKKEVGALRIEVNVPRADVLVDGKPVGQAPLDGEVFVEAGAHMVEAKLAGYVTASRGVEATKGGTGEVALVLREEAPEVVVVPPVAVVPRPVWPVVMSGVLTAGGVAAGIGFTVAANAKSGDADALAAKLPLSSCAGVASGQCKTLKDALRSQSMLASAAVGGFIGGGTLALVTAGLGVWAVAGPKRETVRVAPLVSAQGGGVVVLGVW